MFNKIDAPMIAIGPNPETVKAVSDGIHLILNSPAEQRTLRAALEVFAESVAIDETHVINCTFVKN